MARATLVGVVLLTMVGFLTAGDQPKGPPPRVMKAEIDKQGQAYLPMTVHSIRQEARTYTVEVNGRKEQRVQMVMIPVVEQFMVGLNDPGVEVYDTNGKRLDINNKRFAGPMAVLVSADANRVDPFFLRLVREGTLVVVVTRNHKSGPDPKRLPPTPKEEPKDEKKP